MYRVFCCADRLVAARPWGPKWLARCSKPASQRSSVAPRSSTSTCGRWRATSGSCLQMSRTNRRGENKITLFSGLNSDCHFIYSNRIIQFSSRGEICPLARHGCKNYVKTLTSSLTLHHLMRGDGTTPVSNATSMMDRFVDGQITPHPKIHLSFCWEATQNIAAVFNANLWPFWISIVQLRKKCFAHTN